MKYEVLAGAKLGPKKEMSQFFPFLLQLVNNPTFVTLLNLGGYKFNVVSAFKLFASAAGWKYSQEFIEKMTEQEQAKADAQLPSAIAAQHAKSQAGLEQQKFEQNVKEEQEKQLSKAGAEVIRTTTEHAMAADPMAQTFGQETAL
jgi:type IV secretory pathway VirB9-like protein